MRLTVFKAIVIFTTVGFCLSCEAIRKISAKQGSTFLIQMETDSENKEEIFRRAIDRMQRLSESAKVVTEIDRTPNSSTAVVKVYETDKIEQIKKLLFTNYVLELKKVVSPPIPRPLLSYATEKSAKENIKENQEVLLFQNSKTEKFVIVESGNIVTGEEVRDARAVLMPDENVYQIQFTLKPAGAVKFGDWTGANINNYLAIVIDKKIVSVPFIKSQIFDSGQIDGRFTAEEAENIALSLKSGQVPVKCKILSETKFKN
jgi:preprotein translocase subunit SecD